MQLTLFTKLAHCIDKSQFFKIVQNNQENNKPGKSNEPEEDNQSREPPVEQEDKNQNESQPPSRSAFLKPEFNQEQTVEGVQMETPNDQPTNQENNNGSNLLSGAWSNLKNALHSNFSTKESLLCSTNNPSPCQTGQPVTIPSNAPQQTKPLTFLNQNDFCKYLTYYDAHDFSNSGDKVFYTKIMNDYPGETIRCKNSVKAPEITVTPSISNNTITIGGNCGTNSSNCDTIKTVTTPQVITKIVERNCQDKTIISNGQTTIIPTENVCKNAESAFTSNKTCTVSAPPQVVISTIVKPVIVTVTQPAEPNKTIIQNTKPAPKPPKQIVIVKDDDESKEEPEVDADMLKSLTMLIKELLDHKKECGDKKDCKHGHKMCKHDSAYCNNRRDNSEYENSSSDNSKDNVSDEDYSEKMPGSLKSLLKDVIGSKGSNLLGLDYLKSKFHGSKAKPTEINYSSVEFNKTVSQSNKKPKDSSSDSSECNSSKKPIYTTTPCYVAGDQNRHQTLTKTEYVSGGTPMTEKPEDFKKEMKKLEEKKKEIEEKRKELDKKSKEFEDSMEAKRKEIEDGLDKKQKEFEKQMKAINKEIHKSEQQQDKEDAKEQKQKEKEQNKEIKQLEKELAKQKKANKPEVLPENTVPSITVTNTTVTTDTLITELVKFINLDKRTEEDIMKMLDLIAKVKNNKEKGETYTRLIRTITITVEKTQTVTASAGDSNINNPPQTVKSKPENNTNNNSNNNTNGNTDKETNDKNQGSDEENPHVEESILDKIKTLLNLNKPPKYFDEVEIYKLQREIEKKDAEIEKLREKHDKKKLEGLEEEEFEKMKKKLTKMAEKRQKIIEKMIENETMKEKDLKEDKTPGEELKKIEEEMVHTVTVTRHIKKGQITKDNKNSPSKGKETIDAELNSALEKVKKEMELEINKETTIADKKNVNKKEKRDKLEEKSSSSESSQTKPTKPEECKDEKCKQEMELKSAEIKLLDTNTNKHIKINIPVKEINEAIEDMKKKD